MQGCVVWRPGRSGSERLDRKAHRRPGSGRSGVRWDTAVRNGCIRTATSIQRVAARSLLGSCPTVNVAWHVFALYPALAAWADLFFPKGDNLLETVDPVASRFEYAGVAMGSRAGNQQGGCPRLEVSKPLHDGDPFYGRPTLADFFGDLAELRLRHRCVRLILKPRSLTVFRSLGDRAHDSGEDAGRARRGPNDCGQQLVQVERLPRWAP